MSSFNWESLPPRLELIEYVRKPQVICRIIILLLAIVVIGIVHNDCQIYGECLFHGDNSACGYAIFLGSTAIIISIVFMIIDMWVDNIPNSDSRKTIALADLIIVGIFTFLWFVGFCLLCNRWQNTTDKFLEEKDVSPTGPQAAIAFTFFSFIAWGALTYLANMAYTAVRLLVPEMGAGNPADASNFGAYTDPSAHTYHGFTRDAEMLDPTRPAQLRSDSPSFGYGHGSTGTTTKPSAGGVFTGTAIEAYQP